MPMTTLKRPWVRSFLSLLAAAPVLSPTASAGDASWIEIKSPHFLVVTDAGERRGREVAVRFEQMRSVFSRLIENAHVNLPVPLQIVAFRNSKEFRQISPLWNGKPVELAGLFIGGDDRCFIMLDMGVEDPWRVVFHEYAHQLMNGTITAHMDPWFEEGFAEYFASIEVGSHHAQVGKIPDMTYNILHQQGMMKVADLFKVQHDSSTYNEIGERRTVFYAESALVVHYIFDNKMFSQLAKYSDLKFNKNLTVEDALQQSFGMSAADLNKTIQSYLAVGTYHYYQMKTPDDIETTGYTTQPIGAADASAVIADIHAHSRDYRENAIPEFEDILKSDPNNAALRGLGYAFLQDRQFEKARDCFQRAVKANSKDARVYYYSGLLANIKAGFAGESDLTSTVNELKTAVSLDPNFADAYMQLAIAQSGNGDVESALANTNKAISLNPRNQSYYFNLADLYMRQRKTDEALNIFRVLTKSSNPAVALRASAAVGQIETMQQAMKEAQSPRLVEVSPTSSTSPDTHEPAASSGNSFVPNGGTIQFLKGTIVSVDCSSPPAATLTVVSSGKRWTLQLANRDHALVIGADAFSCGWKGQKAALNYRDNGDFTGSVVSIEIQ